MLQPTVRLRPDWDIGYLCAIGVIALFLCISFVVYGMSGVPVMWNALLALGYGVLVLTAAVVMVIGGGGMAALPYFLIGTAIFFGFGTYISVNEVASSLYFTEGQQIQLLPKVNLVNALAIFCATLAAGVFVFRRERGSGDTGDVEDKLVVLLPYFNFVLVGAACVVFVEWYTFPRLTDKNLASVMTVVEILPAFALFLGGAVWQKLTQFHRAALLLTIVLVAAEGLLSARKVTVIMPFLSFALGLWVGERHRLAAVFTACFGVVLYVAFLSSAVAHIRSHTLYDPSLNTVEERVQIFSDVITSLDDRNIDVISQPLLARFSPTQFSAHFISSYDNNFRGDSLDNALVVLVPRILWPEKPIINPGKHFDSVWRDIDFFTALAIGFPAEAYWNQGWLGVIAVSTYIGLMCGWFSWKWFQFRRYGWVHGGIFVMSPLIVKSALWVETNIVGSYIGGWVKFALAVLAIDFLIRALKFLGARVQDSLDQQRPMEIAPRLPENS
ncbi:MAG: hypothetical protein AAFN27_23925 [Pseudomonadota bacterium]